LIRRQKIERNAAILPFYLIRDCKSKNNISRRRVKSNSWWKVLLRTSSLARILDKWPCLWPFFKGCAAVIYVDADAARNQKFKDIIKFRFLNEPPSETSWKE
jgi:hypothetical protein